jgi:hypothetical protein
MLKFAFLMIFYLVPFSIAFAGTDDSTCADYSHASMYMDAKEVHPYLLQIKQDAHTISQSIQVNNIEILENFLAMDSVTLCNLYPKMSFETALAASTLEWIRTNN